MVAGLGEQGTAILNADDQFFPMLVAMTAARVTSFGVVAGDFRAEGYRALEGGGGQFSVRGVEVKLGLEGRHQAVNAVAALATGVTAGGTLPAGAEALANVAVEHRLPELPPPAGLPTLHSPHTPTPHPINPSSNT